MKVPCTYAHYYILYLAFVIQMILRTTDSQFISQMQPQQLMSLMLPVHANVLLPEEC